MGTFPYQFYLVGVPVITAGMAAISYAIKDAAGTVRASSVLNIEASALNPQQLRNLASGLIWQQIDADAAATGDPLALFEAMVTQNWGIGIL
jgi:hypothetical protein